MAQYGAKAFSCVRSIAAGAEVQQEPDQDGGHENSGPGLFQVALHLFPHIDAYGMEIGHLVFRQLNQEVIFRLPVLGFFDAVEQQGHQDGHHQTDQVHGIGHHHGVAAEEHFRK